MKLQKENSSLIQPQSCDRLLWYQRVVITAQSSGLNYYRVVVIEIAYWEIKVAN